MTIPLIINGGNSQLELLRIFASMSHGFKNEDVAIAAGSLVVNALSQNAKTLSAAEQRLDQLVAGMREHLHKKYWPNGKILKAASVPTAIVKS